MTGESPGRGSTVSDPARRFGVLAVGMALHVACGSDGDPSAARGLEVEPLPVRYAADRFYVTPVTTGGDTLAFYTDTGGGAHMIWERTVERLELEPEWVAAGDDSARLVALPELRPDAAIPAPRPLPPFGRRLLVTEPPSAFDVGDGFLGRLWFADRVWVFDYPGRTLGLVPAGAPVSHDAAHQVALGFQTDSAGNRTTHFPRITVQIDGDSLDLLFDTGATTELTDAALRELDDGGPAVRGTSFIVRSVFEDWRRRHPDWRMIEGADRVFGESMIRVPELEIAGHVVGPVWFTTRPDSNFRETMSRWMDRRIDGALGGSGLRYFRVVVDYPAATATFLHED